MKMEICKFGEGCAIEFKLVNGDVFKFHEIF